MVVEEDEDVALLASEGGRTSEVVGSLCCPTRTRFLSASSFPINTSLSPTNSTFLIVVGMSRCPYASEVMPSARRNLLSANEHSALFLGLMDQMRTWERTDHDKERNRCEHA